MCVLKLVPFNSVLKVAYNMSPWSPLVNWTFKVTFNQKNLYYVCNLYNDSIPDNADILVKSCAFLPFHVLSHYCFHNRHLLDTFSNGHTIFYKLNTLLSSIGILALKPVLWSIGNSRRTWRKTDEKLHTKIWVNLKKQF